MVVCHCHLVNDRTIAKLASAAGGELSFDDVTAHCGAGVRCGGCYDTICDILDSQTNERPTSR